MVPESASRAPLNADASVTRDADDSAERWRQWDLRNAAASRRDSKRMRFIFMGLFAALGVWSAIHFLGQSVAP